MKFGINSAPFGNDVVTEILDSHKILTSFLTAVIYVMFLC